MKKISLEEATIKALYDQLDDKEEIRGLDSALHEESGYRI